MLLVLTQNTIYVIFINYLHIFDIRMVFCMGINMLVLMI